MDLRVVLLGVANLAMVYAGFVYGIRFIRNFGNYLLGLEWLVVAISGSNVVVLGATGIHHDSGSYHLMLFFDAFSRAVGLTLILVLGLMTVTHRYRPSLAVDIGVFALAIVAGFFLSRLHQPIPFGWAVFYIVVNLLTTIYLLYFALRLWSINARAQAIWALIATILGAVVAVVYDMVHIPGDDADHMLFYIGALSTWALQLTVYYYGYRTLHAANGEQARNVRLDGVNATTFGS
ncbi:transporter [Nocardia sp. NPDC058058]|uniref:transporter n=1 Tax=Nocardia sp. NPDC058058 TaxID=3346317 RepID=UPI0036DEC017